MKQAGLYPLTSLLQLQSWALQGSAHTLLWRTFLDFGGMIQNYMLKYSDPAWHFLHSHHPVSVINYLAMQLLQTTHFKLVLDSRAALNLQFFATQLDISLIINPKIPQRPELQQEEPKTHENYQNCVYLNCSVSQINMKNMGKSISLKFTFCFITL